MSSTERLTPRAFSIERIGDDDLVELGAGLGVSGGSSAALRRAITARFGDRNATATRLGQLSGLSLVALEVLAEGGGMMSTDAVSALVRARTGCAEAALSAAVAEADAGAFLVALRLEGPAYGRGRGARQQRTFGLVAPWAEHVAALVRGVTLPPPEPPGDARPHAGAIGERERDRVALAGLTAHRELRFTSGYGAHGAQLKRFGKSLGMELERVRELVESAARADLLGAKGDVFAPRVDRLLAHAGGIDEWLDAWLPPEGWTSVEAIARTSARDKLAATGGGWEPTADVVVSTLQDARDRVFAARGVEVVEAHGSAWVRRRRAAAAAPVDGHVTPSFDVLLGPTPDLRLLAIVALGCELVRIDRMLTFRLTPASVQSGLAVGLSASELTAALARIGKHGVPANVQAMLADWIGRHRPTRLAKVWMIVVPPSIADALAGGELREHIVDRPAPNVLAVDAEVPRARLDALLQDSGVRAGDVVSLSQGMRDRYEAKYRPDPRQHDDEYDDEYDDDDPWPRAERQRQRATPARLALPLRFEGDPALAARVSEARRAGFPPPARTAATGSRPSPPSARDVESDPGERKVRRAAETLRALHAEMRPDLQRWARRLSAADRAHAVPLLESAGQVAPLLIASRKARQRALGTATCFEQLMMFAMAEVDRGCVSPSGELVLPWLGEAAALLDEEGAQTDRSTPAPRQSPSEIRATLEAACASRAVVRLSTRGGDGGVHRVAAMSLQRRGASAALLAVDAVTDEGRVFALEDVLRVDRDAAGGPSDASV